MFNIMVYHLLYLSSATMPFDYGALDLLLEASRRRNAMIGVSGMLLHADSSFIQYIEGEEDAVQNLFARIEKDSRHGGLLTVSKGFVPARVFPDWSMGFQAWSADEDHAPGTFDLSRAELAQRLGTDAPAILLTMMRSFYESTHRFHTL